jgi:hypothetical protein
MSLNLGFSNIETMVDRPTSLTAPSMIASVSSNARLETLDEERNLLYIGTGDNYTAAATDTSDVVVALDRTTGRIVWSRQMTENDIYNGSCAAKPEGCGPDFDFGHPLRSSLAHPMVVSSC